VIRKSTPEACKLEDTMATFSAGYITAIDAAALIPVQPNPFAQGFHLNGETISHSESTSPKLTRSWEDQENKKPGDTDEDVELHQLMEDIKRYIRSIDISDL
jgi:hypothetical protein